MTTPNAPPAPLPSTSRLPIILVAALIVMGGLGYFGWRMWFMDKPQPQPPDMTKAMEANIRGVGHMEHFFQFAEAATDFEEALKFAPDWTPAKINLGIALLNIASQESLERARGLLDEVVKKEPDNPHAHYCLGIIAHHRGRPADAYPHFEAVSRIDPNDAHTWLHMGFDHPRGKESAAAKECFERALKLDPYLNAARHNLAFHPVDYSEERKKQILDEFLRLSEAGAATDYEIKYTKMGRYAEVIGRIPDGKPPEIGPLPLFEKWEGFRVKLAEGTSWAKAEDLDDLTRGVRARFGATVVFLDFNGDHRPDILLCSAVVRNKQLGDVLLRNDGQGAFADVSAAAGLTGQASLGCTVADYDNDGNADLFLTGHGPPRLLRNLGGGKFEDVSAAAGLKDLAGVFLSATWVDLDQDGDLDLLLARFAETAAAARGQLQGKAEAQGELLVFLNVGEAPAVKANEPQPGLSTRFEAFVLPRPIRGAVIGAATGDLDGDRDLDLLAVADGRPARGVWNDRLLRFRDAGELGEAGAWNGALLLDVNHDQRSDLLVLSADKPPVLWMNTSQETQELLARVFGRGAVDSPALRQAQAVDLDFDGWTDVVGLSADGKPVLVHNDGAGKLVQRPDAFGAAGAALGLGVADLDGDGPLDLVLLTESGLEVRRSLGNGNHAIRLDISGRREKSKQGMRTNADGAGAWVSAQAGPLWTGIEKASLQAGLGRSSLPLDLGIGKATQADIIRIRWPDGVPQAELHVSVGRPSFRVAETDRRPTSCPVLFVWDGQRYRFVTDILGAGALGEAGADGSTRPPRPEESIKIEPGLLAARDGWYRIKIAEPMDEVLYLDHLQLVVVDHLPGHAVYPDERFAAAGPAPTQRLLLLDDIRAAKKGTDDHGRDVTELLRERDRSFVDDFRVRTWLGFAEEHWVELDFGQVAVKPGERRILCLAGWTDYPFPESIFAAQQAGVELLEPKLEYQSPGGEWKVWGELGFPAGLPRTMTRDVTELVELGKGRFRIRTNMQIFWDQAFLGRLRPEKDQLRVTSLEVGRATLQHHGFAREVLPGGRPPVVYDGELTEPVAVTPWKGRLTRFGDVTELLLKSDDRFVLCGPGDEIEIGFDARKQPPVPKDWVRSFVLRSWGYSKDTSPFTATGGSVLPLPYRDMPDYPSGVLKKKPPAAVEDYDRLWNTRRTGRE